MITAQDLLLYQDHGFKAVGEQDHFNELEVLSVESPCIFIKNPTDL